MNSFCTSSQRGGCCNVQFLIVFAETNLQIPLWCSVGRNLDTSVLIRCIHCSSLTDRPAGFFFGAIARACSKHAFSARASCDSQGGIPVLFSLKPFNWLRVALTSCVEVALSPSFVRLVPQWSQQVLAPGTSSYPSLHLFVSTPHATASERQWSSSTDADFTSESKSCWDLLAPWMCWLHHTYLQSSIGIV